MFCPIIRCGTVPYRMKKGGCGLSFLAVVERSAKALGDLTSLSIEQSAEVGAFSSCKDLFCSILRCGTVPYRMKKGGCGLSFLPVAAQRVKALGEMTSHSKEQPMEVCAFSSC
jgi:hypothetical protein